jgi:hypothetical protein
MEAALACHATRYVRQSIVMAYHDGGDTWLDEGAPLDGSPNRAARSSSPVTDRTTSRPSTSWTWRLQFAASLELAPAGSTFNIVDEPIRYGDYADALADLTGTARPRRARELRRPPSWRCRNDAAGEALGWTPKERIWPYIDADLHQ